MVQLFKWLFLFNEAQATMHPLEQVPVRQRETFVDFKW